MVVMTVELMSLLMVHFLCNAQASVTQMSVSDAKHCSAQFEQLKIGFHPDFTLEEFNRLEDAERSRISVEAYDFYRKWLGENPDIVLKLKDTSALMLSARL
jgi:hypothetical protein